jgi:hypothetical protein
MTQHEIERMRDGDTRTRRRLAEFERVTALLDPFVLIIAAENGKRLRISATPKRPAYIIFEGMRVSFLDLCLIAQGLLNEVDVKETPHLRSLTRREALEVLNRWIKARTSLFDYQVTTV